MVLSTRVMLISESELQIYFASHALRSHKTLSPDIGGHFRATLKIVFSIH